MSLAALAREKAEKEIRALLVSSPVGLTIQELTRDYIQFIGYPLPFREFGYNTIEDYVNDIPSVLTTTWQNGNLVLKATSDKTTCHIEKLVSQQRIPNKNKWAVLRQRSNRYSERYSKPKYISGPSVPVYVRQQIQQMFRHIKSLPMSHFDNFFYKCFGHHLDYEWLGFKSVKGVLDSIPNTVTLVNQNGEWRVMPSYSSRQQQQPVKWTSQNSRPTVSTPPIFLPHPVSPIKPNEVQACSPPKDVCLGSSPESEELIDPIHVNLRKVLASQPKGILASKLNIEYKSVIGKHLPFKEHGYHSVIEFVNDIPTVVRIERPNPCGDWVLYDSSAPVSPSEQSSTRNVVIAVDRKVSQDIKHAITQVLQTFPDGITMSKFLSTFQDLTGRQIDPTSMGFSGLESMLLSLTEDILQATYNGKEMMISSATENCQPQVNPVTAQVESQQEKYGIPEDSILPGTYYASQMLPDTTGEYIELFVSNIVSPGLFWLQLRGRQTTVALENLMDAISDYYTTVDSNRYKMPSSLYMIGQLCAVIFPEDNNWHRGIITGIRSVEIIEVYFVDYGNTCSVQKDTLRLLRSKFRRLPAQAIQARLANIRPVKESWSIGARDNLLQVCINKPLIGFVTAVRDRVLSLCLTDTSQLEDIHINDMLVDKEYARFAPDELHPSTLGPTNFAEVPGDDLLYGFSTQPTNDIVTATGSSDVSYTTISLSDLPQGSRYVKLIDATEEHSFHLINLHGFPYLLSSEISALFWSKDFLSSKLMMRDVRCCKIQVIKNEQKECFQELQAFGVVDKDKQIVSLYSLNDMPKILECFNHPCTKLRSAILKILKDFDPEENYWKGEVKENFDLSAKIAQEIEDSQFDLEELQVTLKALQFKRKRILKRMMSHTGSSVELVNQLQEVEVQMAMTTEVIEEVKITLEAETVEEELSVSGESVPSQVVDYPQELIQDTTELLKVVPTNVKTIRVAPMVVNTPSSQPASSQSQPFSNYGTTNQDTFNLLQQQQQYLIQMQQSVMTPQLDTSLSGIMPHAMPYQSIIQNPLMQQWGFQQMPTNLHTSRYWPPPANFQQMNYRCVPNSSDHLPGTNYSARLPVSNPQVILPGMLGQNLASRFPIMHPNVGQYQNAFNPSLNMNSVDPQPPESASADDSGTGLLPNMLDLLQNMNLGRGRSQDTSLQ